jgi:hypothetical protein
VPARRLTEFARELDQRFVGFRAAVAEKHLARSGEADEPLRQLSLPGIVIKIRAVDERLRLPREHLREGGMGMAQAVDGHASTEIEIAAPLLIPNAPTLAPHQRQAAPRRGHDVPVVESFRRGSRGRREGRHAGDYPTRGRKGQ